MDGMSETQLVMSVNSGSSSLKIAFFRLKNAKHEDCVLSGLAERRAEGWDLTLRNEVANPLFREFIKNAPVLKAFEILYDTSQRVLKETPSIIGHRIVHGGPGLMKHQLIDTATMRALSSAIDYAPSHLPAAIELVCAVQLRAPSVPNVACFDTTFHRTMPPTSKRLPIPKRLHDAGVQRYGFHGLSYDSVVQRLRDDLPERMILVHLGNGASLCAVRHGRSIDTTMSFTPTGGIPMSTRSGDLDPSILLYLMRTQNLGADGLEDLLTHRAGLKGVSDQSGDMRDLLARWELDDPEADLAINVFTLAIRKQIGAYAALLGGVDMLVFTGGIGEHSQVLRNMICGGLDFLGVHVDGPRANVKVMAAEEERQIARICRCFL